MEDRQKNCFVAAAILKQHASDSSNPKLANICSAGYMDVGQYLDEYEAGVRIAPDFVKEIHAGAKYLAELKDVTVYKLEDAAFSLFESLAVIMREVVLRNKGGSAPRQVQKEILRSFETSKQWLPEDPTLVSEYFYHKIPALLAAGGDPRKMPDTGPDTNAGADLPADPDT